MLKWTGLGIIDHNVRDYFIDLTKRTLELREEKNIVRKDFFQLLVQLRNDSSGQLADEEHRTITDNSSKMLTLNELAAQVFIFYVAGFETSSEAMTFCLFEIARNPDIQRKVHDEIDCVLAQHGGELTYDAINDLKYLECCIDG